MDKAPATYNSHHVFWTRKEYTTPIQRRVRNMGAYIIRVNIDNHQELHANLLPPPKLVSEEYHDLYDFMQVHVYELNGIEGLEWGIAWANSRRLYDLEENLDKQYLYLADYQEI